MKISITELTVNGTTQAVSIPVWDDTPPQAPTPPAPVPAPPAPVPAPPAPTPSPPPPPATPPAAGDPPQFVATDTGDGPTRLLWNRHLGLPWRNLHTGDWTDAAGVPQGSGAFAVAEVATLGVHSLDITPMVQAWQASGECKGVLLRYGGKSSPSATWGGRLSATPPLLAVTYADGTTQNLAARSFAGWSTTSDKATNTAAACKTSTIESAIVCFDATELRPGISSAVLALTCVAKGSYPGTLSAFETDPPRYVLGGTPVMGLSAEVGEAALAAHADVLAAGDFSDIEKGHVFTQVQLNEVAGHELLPDPDAPGTMMFRSRFVPGNDGNNRGSATFKTEHMRADETDPRRPPAITEREMFCRVYIFLEDDWRSTRDGNKMAIGWDLRMGWWNPAQGGYWQSTTGNGGAKGTGLKRLVPKQSAALPGPDQWLYEGHSIRMEAGVGPMSTDDPYEALRPVQSYVYNLDQVGGYGEILRFGNAVIARGRWHCIEQQIKINSIVGPFDSMGNGQAVADGVLRTWIDGVLAAEVTDLRWHRHPEMGVQGPWVNWYYGGKMASEREMHYRMNHFVVARRYIGPRVALRG